MKKSLYPFLLAWALTACQPQPQAYTEFAKAVPVPAGIVSSAAAATPTKTATTVAQPAPLESLSPQMREVFQAHDLSQLLQTVHSSDAHAQNGFFGPDHYRIEMAFTDVQRDPAHSTVYFLRGKDRYKGRITPFTGTFTVSRFSEQPPYSAGQIAAARQHDYTLPDTHNLYATEGDFELREDSTHHGAGVFRGKLDIDWRVDDDGSLALENRNEQSSSQGGWIKYEGTWTNTTTHRTYPVVWVENIFGYSDQHPVLDKFTIGERDPDFNPKYAKLGWNSYWENKEWWADSKRLATAYLPPVPSDMTVAPSIVADSVPTRQ